MGRSLKGGAAVDGSSVSVRKFFNRFNRNELIDVVKSQAELDAVDLVLPKGKLISAVLARLGSRITYDQVAQIDMQYNQLHTKSKKWAACEMRFTEGVPSPRFELEELHAELSQHLSAYFDVHVFCGHHDGAVWVRLFIQDGVKPASQLTTVSNTIYLIHTPHTNHIYMSNVKVAHRDYVSQAIISSFGCTNVEVSSLTGRSVDGLKELTHFQDSQGMYSEYRQNWHDSHPLSREAPRKRRRHDGLADSDIDGNAVVEDAVAIDAQRDASDAAFGGAEPPELEKAEFQLDTKCLGSSELNLSGQYRARVKFDGPSILVGLRELVKIGAAETPLPTVLSTLNSSGKNKFVITEN
eukprot:m.15471 g.15471  ORF g.15471 m.15471 type:complete len:353 (-) comp8668_c0_seq1:104-1162(-)